MATRRKGQQKGKTAKKPPAKRGGRRRTTWGKSNPPPKSPGRPPLPPDYKLAMEDLGPRAVQALSAIVDNPEHPRHEQAIEYALNRWKGTPTARTEISGPKGGPVPVNAVTTSGAKRARVGALLAAAAARVAAGAAEPAKQEPDGSGGAG
jgi:hypothetical protein